MQTTNAHDPNEESVAQRTYEAFLAGRPKLLYDCREGRQVPDLTDTKEVKAALRESYGDSYWAPVEGLVDLATDPLTPNAVFYRFYLNHIMETADSFIARPLWDALRQDEDPIRPGDQIAIGFDGSLRSDSTVICGVRLRDGKCFLIHVQEAPEGATDWQVDALLVDKAMRAAVETYRVEWILADPSYWQNQVGQWALDFRERDRDGRDIVFEFPPQRARQMAEAIERFHTAVVLGQDIRHDGNPVLASHVSNAVTYEVPQGTLIRKESKNSRKKIDALIAAILGYEARALAIEDGRMRIRRRARMRTY
ncbi:terminase TerL endonuclease subunit [Spirillospora sp. NPDC127200]